MKSGKKRTITQRSPVTTNEGNKKLNICTSPVSIPEAALTSPVGASQRNNTFQTNVTTINISEVMTMAEAKYEKFEEQIAPTVPVDKKTRI